MQIGYARVSTLDQNPDLQLDALLKAGCEKTFVDKLSGAKVDRPSLAEALEFARTGDTIVVWRLDRLARSVGHLIEITRSLDERSIALKSLTETIDTSTTGGRLIFHVFAAIAQFERDLIRERTQAGLAAARARGRVGGRPRVVTAEKLTAALKLIDGGTPVPEVARAIGVGVPSLYRHLALAKQGGAR